MRFPNNSHFLGSCISTDAAFYWSLHRNLLSNFTPTIRQITNQSIARYIFWHHLSIDTFKRTSEVIPENSPIFVMWRFLWLANVLVLSQSVLLCEEAQKKCVRDFTKCGAMLLKIFNGDVCKSALGYDDDWPNGISGPMAKTCPLTCVSAIINLTATAAGKQMETCDCDRDASCLTIRARLQRCLLSSQGNYTFVSCTAARKRCNEDKRCKAIQQRFLRRCSSLISGVECTQDCKKSQDELLGSVLGKALNDCECDGREELYCRGIRANYEALCKGTRGPRRPEYPSPTEQTVMRAQHDNQNSRANSQFELPVWIFYAAIMAHISVFLDL